MLAFAGLKMILGEVVHVPALVSVAIIVVCIGASLAASLWARRRP